MPSQQGQRLSMVIPYTEHWEIDLRNFMAGRRAEDYRIEDRSSTPHWGESEKSGRVNLFVACVTLIAVSDS